MNNSDMPAMPLPMVLDDEGVVLDAGDYCPHNNGLSKREHFAAMAMQGLLSSEIYVKLLSATEAEAALLNISVMAVEHADALLAALEKQS